MKAKRWYRRRRSAQCSWIGQTRKKPYACKQAILLCALGLTVQPHLSAKPLVRLQIRWSIWTWLRRSSARSSARISLVSHVLVPEFTNTPLLPARAHPGDDKKVLCQSLAKLYLPSETGDDDKVRTLKLLVENLRTRRPPREASALAALAKFDNALSKRFEKQLEDFDEAEYRQLESLRELFEFLDDIVPLDEDEDEEDEAPSTKKRGARKRRSESVTTDTTSADEGVRTPPRGKGGKARSKYVSTLYRERRNMLIYTDDVGHHNPMKTMRTM